MNSGMSGYGRINYQGPLPVGGGATAGAPVGGAIQQLLRMMAAPGGRQMPQQTDPQAELEMAKALGLIRQPKPNQQADARPLESWLGGPSIR